MRRLAVFPGSSLREYLAKGEIKSKYYNPLNVFSEVHFITLVNPQDELCDDELPEIQDIVGNARLFVHPVGRLSAGGMAYPRIRRRALQALAAIQPHCVRTYSQYLEGQIAASCCRRLNIPLVASLHTTAQAEAEQEPLYRPRGIRADLRSRVVHAIKQRMEARVIKDASVLLAVSDYLAKSAATVKGAESKLRVIYNKVYTEHYRTAPPPANHPRCILTVGSLVARKYQDPIIAAIAGLDVRLKVIGHGPRKRELQALARRLGVERQTEFIDRVPSAEMPQQYEGCDIVAISTHYEGFCIPVLEGMAAGKPVVVSDTPPLPEILGGTGMVVEKTAAGFRGAFIELLEHPHLRIALGQRARQRAGLLDGTVMEEREGRVYRELCAEAHAVCPDTSLVGAARFGDDERRVGKPRALGQ